MKSLPKFRYNLRSKLFLVLCGLSLVSSVLFVTNINGRASQLPSIGVVLPSSKQISIEELANFSTYTGLPVAKVEEFNVPNAWGTVIYLPQYHRSPGSDAEDKVNNAGAKSQEQIYQIADFLIEKGGINLAMVEGALFGEVPAENVALLANKIEKRNELATVYEDLKKSLQGVNLNLNSENKLLKQLLDELTLADRELILEGASEKLKAEGENFKLFGSENKETREESKLVLRDYIFLTDRIKQLDTPLNKSIASRDQIKGLANPNLRLFSSRDNTQPEFYSLESAASSSGNDKLVNLLKEAEKAFNELTRNTPDKVMVQSAPDNPSREDNPYKDITDKAILQEKLASAKEKMEQIIIEKRNRETAENFTKALRQEDEKVGILQFGAGHKTGLVKELNNQGLNVITITVDEVSNRNLIKKT